MLFSTINQAQVFIAAVYGGLIIGACYDILRALRRTFRAGRAATAVLDIVFALIMGGVILAVLILATYGEIRGYSLLGFVCGAALYMAALSRLLLALLRRLLGGLRIAFLWVSRRPIIRRILR